MKKQKKFTVHYKVDSIREAYIPADDITEALEKAKTMNLAQLDAAPGDIIDEEHRITAVFE
jgi:hypothetical protein